MALLAGTGLPADHCDRVVLDHVEDALGELAEQDAAAVAADDGLHLGMPLDGDEAGVHCRQGLVAQARVLLFIPRLGVAELDFGLRAEDEAPGHPSPLMCWRTSCQEEPAAQ